MRPLIGLIDIDSRIPNLALATLSAYHKAQGHAIHLNVLTPETASPRHPDQVYCPVVFQKQRQKVAALTHAHHHCAHPTADSPAVDKWSAPSNCIPTHIGVTPGYEATGTRTATP